jgi:hypothetical protein
MILNENEARNLIKDSQKIPNFIDVGRALNKELAALVEGDQFLEELINRIERIESVDKANARRKYSRDVQDLFERLFQPIGNVFTATGGEKNYRIDNEATRQRFFNVMSSIRDGKSMQSFVENVWLPLFHTDPNGLIFMEYSTQENNSFITPTYKSINSIRNYKARGQTAEWVVFEPKKIKEGELWRVVDDSFDRTFLVKGDEITFVEEFSFANPFGATPAIVISPIIKIGGKHRLSDIHRIMPITKEYARDQSIKTIYKFVQGIPQEWRYVVYCKTCQGQGKTGDKSCGDCDGRGYLARKDVTDLITLPVPKEGLSGASPTIAGHIKPDLETWTQYTNEIELLEKYSYKTHWGTIAGFDNKSGMATATEVIVNKQPLENRLNKYADTAEWIESQLSEWVLNFIDPLKDKGKKLISIHYGRRYIIDSPDVILDRYEKAKEQNDNTVILDRLFNEYLTAKYRNNPLDLGINLLKAKIEPYLHMNYDQTLLIFGQEETQRKALFNTWWSMLTDFDMTAEQLTSQYNTWFASNKTNSTENQ